MADKDFKDRRLFSAVEDPEDRRALFKRFVHNVIIEASSHCNRKCGYCPVATSDRYHSNVDIAPDVYDGVLQQLASIDYDERVCLNLYNEPMSQLAQLMDKIRRTRAALPKSHIYFSTNGDYLNRETLEGLHEAGLTSLIITVHMPHSKPYDDNYILSRFIELGIRCRSRIKIKAVDLKSHVYGDMLFKRMPIEVFAVNYYEKGYNRADSVQGVNSRFVRKAPCIRPFADFTIAYDGNVFPCCQFFPDSETSKRSAVGSLAHVTDIFAIYASKSLADWRRSLFTRGKKASPCDTCGELNWEVPPSEMRLREAFMEKEFGIARPGAVSAAVDRLMGLSRIR